MNLQIETLEDLNQAIHLNSWLMRPNVRTLQVRQTGFDAETMRKLETQLKILFNDCGCHWAALVLVVSLGLGIGLHLSQSGLSWSQAGVSFLVSVFLSFAAKLAALYWSHRRLGRELKSLVPSFGGSADGMPRS